MANTKRKNELAGEAIWRAAMGVAEKAVPRSAPAIRAAATTAQTRANASTARAQASIPTRENAAARFGGASARDELQANSLGWHLNPSERTAMEMANERIRRMQGWNYDPQSGVSIDPITGQSLVRPTQLVTGTARGADAVRDRMAINNAAMQKAAAQYGARSNSESVPAVRHDEPVGPKLPARPTIQATPRESGGFSGKAIEGFTSLPEQGEDMRRGMSPEYAEMQRQNSYDEQNALTTIGHNIGAGLSGISGNFYKSLNFVLPDVITPKPMQNYMDSAINNADDIQSKVRTYNYDRGGTVGGVAGALFQSALGMLPQTVVALLSGGTSLAAQGTQAMANVGKSVIPRVATQLMKSPAAWASFLQTVGADYEDAKASGASDLQAAVSAITSSGLNAGIEVGSGVEALSNRPRGLKTALRTGVEEGMEEVWQGIATNLTQKAVYDKNKQYFSMDDPNAVINPQRIGMDFGGGWVLGTIVGGGNAILEKLGESGKKAHRAVNNAAGESDEAQDAQFVRYYEAGKVNLPMEKVPAMPNTTPLSPEIAFAAHAAGQNDAAAQQAAKTQTVGHEAGTLRASGQDAAEPIAQNEKTLIGTTTQMEAQNEKALKSTTKQEAPAQAGAQNVTVPISTTQTDASHLGGRGVDAMRQDVAEAITQNDKALKSTTAQEASALTDAENEKAPIGTTTQSVSTQAEAQNEKALKSTAEQSVSIQEKAQNEKVLISTTQNIPLSTDMQNNAVLISTTQTDASHQGGRGVDAMRQDVAEAITQSDKVLKSTTAQSASTRMDTENEIALKSTVKQIDTENEKAPIDTTETDASGFGERGAAAYAVHESGADDKIKFRDDFERAYIAGALSQEQTARTDSGTALRGAARRDAWEAGQRDAQSTHTAFARAGAPGISDDVRAALPQSEAAILDAMTRDTGTRVELLQSIQGGSTNGYYNSKTATIYLARDADMPLISVAKHELTHRLQELAPESYAAFRKYAVETWQASSKKHADVVQGRQITYADSGVQISLIEAMDEIAADFAGDLLTDPEKVRTMAREHRTLAERFLEALRNLIARVKAALQKKNGGKQAKEFSPSLTQMEKAEALFRETLKEGAQAVRTQKNAAPMDGKTRYSLNPDFEKALDAWDGQTDKTFTVGATSKALQEIGVQDRAIIWRGRKISEILRKHSAMSRDILKQVPQILENPIIILQSKQADSRIVLFGEVWDTGGAPVTAVLELLPTNHGGTLLDLNIIASAYGKNTNPAEFVRGSNVLYLNPDKKRTNTWLQGLGLQLPSDATTYGSIGSISYEDGKVNTRGVLYEDLTRGDALSEGGTNRFSIKYDANNTPYVVIEQDILAGVPRNEWVKTVKDNLRKRFPDGVTVGRSTIEINKNSRREMTFSNYMQQLFKTKQVVYADKLRATNNADEILKATRNWINEALLHPRKDDIVEFARGEVQLQVGGNGYSAQVIVGRRSNESLLLYDIIKLNKSIINKNKKTVDTTYTANVQNEPRSRQVVSTNNSISLDEQDVNHGNDLKDVTRKSIKGARKAEQEYLRLAETNSYLREQMKLSKGAKVDRKSVDKLAREIRTEYSSTYEHQALTRDLTALYDGFANGKDATGNAVGWEDIRTRAAQIAEKMIENAQVLNDELFTQYRDMREFIKKTPIFIADRDKADVSGGYEELRRASFGRIKLSKTGTPIDSVFAELSESYPEFFDAEQTTHPADQLARIAEVIGDLQPINKNPHSGEMKRATEQLSYDIIERFYDLPQQKPTFADRQARKLTRQKIHDQKKLDQLRKEKNQRIEEVREQTRARINEIWNKERARRAETVKKLRGYYNDIDDAKRERRDKAELRRKINNHVQQLSTRLVAATDKKHVPEALRTTVADFLLNVDLVTDRQHEDTILRLQKLQDTYRSIVAGQGESYMSVDPDLEGNIEQIKALQKPVTEFTMRELQTLWKVVRAVEASVMNANNLFAKGKFVHVSELGTAFITQNAQRKPFAEKYGIKKALDNLMNINMLQPFDFFHEFGEAGDEIYHGLRTALDTKIKSVKQVSDFAAELLKGINLREWSGKHAKLITHHGINGDMTLTPAQTMSLYLLMKRKQAHDHIVKGGIRQTPIIKKQKGRTVILKSFEPVRFDAEQYETILSSLTQEQREVADRIGEYMSTVLADWGNEASMQMYGYKKFTAKNYFPIKSDTNYTQSELAAGDDARVKNMGFTKTTTQHANNPIIIDDIFDVFARHADDMGTYRAFAPTLEDVERVYNFKSMEQSSVKQSIERTIGQKGNEYFRGLIRNLNMGIRSDSLGEISKTLLANYKAASVGFNKRVILQQPTAIIRATALLDPKYLVRGLVGRHSWDYVKEHAPIAQWKDWGYFQLDTGRQMKDIMLGTDSKLELAREAAMWGAGKADNITWTVLYRAVEAEIADKTGLKRDTKQFHDAANERFNEIVDRTQVVDSVLHRSGLMRSGDVLVNMATSFMAEPTKSYNLLRTSFRDALRTPGRAAKMIAASAALAFLANAIATALAASLEDALRDEDPDETYIEKVLQAFTGVQGDEESAADYVKSILSGNLADNLNPFNMIPIIKDGFSIMQGYDVKRMDMGAIADAKKSADTLFKALAGEGSTTPGYAVIDFLGKTSKLLGLPISNLKREVESMANGALMIADYAGYDTYGMRFSLAKLRVPMNEKNKNYWIDMGFRAKRDNSEETTDEIYDELLDVGVTQEQIDKRIRDDQKETEEYKAKKSAVLEKVSQDLQSSTTYQNLSEKNQEKVNEDAKAYAAATALHAQDGKYALEKWMMKANQGETKHKISIAQFILIRNQTTSLESLRDRKGDSIPNSRGLQIMQAVNNMRGLRESQRKYLYEALGVGKSIIHYNSALVNAKLEMMRRMAG